LPSWRFCVFVLILKPWPESNPPAQPAVAGGALRHPDAQEHVGALASPTDQRDAADAVVSSFCLEPRLWLVASVERWRDQRISVWRAVEPATSASGPDDPTIPIVSFVTEE